MGKPQPPPAVQAPFGWLRAAAARALGVELRALLELVVVVPARAAGHGQHLGDDVEIDRARRTRTACSRAVRPRRTRCWCRCAGWDRSQTRRAPVRPPTGSPGRRRWRIARAAGSHCGNRKIVEVHLVVDDELLPEGAKQAAQPIVVVGADPELVALVLILDGVLPASLWAHSTAEWWHWLAEYRDSSPA